MSDSDLDFGKDLGLISEMVITGRKAEVSKGFYAFLAHNQAEFKKISSIAKHWEIANKVGFFCSQFDPEKARQVIQNAKDLIESATVLSDCYTGQQGQYCLDCLWDQRIDFLDLFEKMNVITPGGKERLALGFKNIPFVPGEFNNERYVAGKSLKSRFAYWLMVQFRNAGIFPQELEAFAGLVYVEAEGGLYAEWDCAIDKVAHGLETIMSQRPILALLKNLNY